MPKKKVSVDYADLIVRAVEEEKAAALDGKAVLPQEDNGVDYEAEYRKQTGRDLATG